MVTQPTKQQIATFFDVVVILAEHENKEYARTGVTIFPGLPRPIPEVKICLDWLFALKNGYDEFKPKNLANQVKEEIKKPAPWNKGKKKVEQPAPKSKASTAKKVVGKVDAVVPPKQVPIEELPPTVLKPGPKFEYAEEVKGQVLIIPDDETILSNPK